MNENKGKLTSLGLIQYMARKGVKASGNREADIALCKELGLFKYWSEDKPVNP